MSEILETRAASARGVVVFPPSIAWDHELFQRPHQLARTFAGLGFLVVFLAEDREDDVEEFREIESNLLLCRSPAAELDSVPRLLLWTFSYNFHLREGFARDSVIVYDWIDDLSVFHHEAALLEANHLAALREADLVVSVARRLHDEASMVRPDALYLPNGVDYDHFAAAANSLPPEPAVEELLRRGRPIAGYCGALAEWFDYALLHDVAEHRPDWSFLLIGPQYPDFTDLWRQPVFELPNVSWIGPRAYEDLSAYLRLFDVALIPFRINEITLATSPIKMYEYFAAAKPVIATPLPECQAIPEVSIAGNLEAFSKALDRARHDAHDEACRRHLQEIARRHTWRMRVETVLERLDGNWERRSQDSDEEPERASFALMESLSEARLRVGALTQEWAASRERAAAGEAHRAELEVRIEGLEERLRESRARLQDVERQLAEEQAENDRLGAALAASERRLEQPDHEASPRRRLRGAGAAVYRRVARLLRWRRR
ncbi:MAG: glycosyltransferase [bacterium]|nr:glycosyltransferase [bacterium]